MNETIKHMRRSLVFCDLCGMQNENDMTSVSKGKQILDICITCFEKISLFYRVKNDFVEMLKDERVPKASRVPVVE